MNLGHVVLRIAATLLSQLPRYTTAVKFAWDPDDDLRPEYKRSDFGALVRGKYAARLAEGSNVVVLEPEVAKVFPNDRAVNEALRGLIQIAESAARPVPRTVRTRTKAD